MDNLLPTRNLIGGHGLPTLLAARSPDASPLDAAGDTQGRRGGIDLCPHSNVHSDVVKQLALGLVENDENGRVFVPWDEIHADFSLKTAA